MHQNDVFLMMLIQDLIAFPVTCLKDFYGNNNNWKEELHFSVMVILPPAIILLILQTVK